MRERTGQAAGAGPEAGAGGDRDDEVAGREAGTGRVGRRTADASGGGGGLRERKRLRTFQAVSDTAIALFLQRGFDAVPVAEIAAAAGVSKPTLFRYFPTKEDLVLHRFADHEDEPARVVAAALAEGGHPVAALAAHFRAGLDRRDPVTGLNDAPEVLAFHRLLYGTPALAARLYAYTARAEHALALALADTPGAGDPPLPKLLAAAQILAVRRVLAEANWRRIADGAGADDVYPDAVREAAEGFANLAPVV